MNGRELLEAMSYIDESLVAASENAPRRVSWRKWGSLAACLTLLFAGSFVWLWFHSAGGMKSADQMTSMAVTEAMMEYAADEAVPAEAPAETAPENMDNGAPAMDPEPPAQEEAGTGQVGSTVQNTESILITVQITGGNRGVILEIGDATLGPAQGQEVTLEYASGESFQEADGEYTFCLVSWDEAAGIVTVEPVDE